MTHNNKEFIIKNATIIMDDKSSLNNASIHVQNGIINAISQKPLTQHSDTKIINANGKILGPGLIDMHIHGCGGFDTESVTEEDFNSKVKHMEQNLHEIQNFLCSNGITSFQLAIIPNKNTLHSIQEALKLKEAKRWEKSFIGVYTEGPFINPSKRGGLSLESIQPYSKNCLYDYLHFKKNDRDSLISCMTIAPETLHSDEIYAILSENSIKAAFGHSMVSVKDVPRISCMHITHLFNAMSPLNHKEQGLAALPFLKEFQNVSFELICDTVHVCPEMLEIVFSAIGTKNLCLISDGMSYAGMKPGEFSYLGKTAVNDGKCCRFKEEGTLIGSSLLINKTGKILFDTGLISINEFFQIAASNPARVLSLKDRGNIEVGKRADMILVDSSLNISDIFCS